VERLQVGWFLGCGEASGEPVLQIVTKYAFASKMLHQSVSIQYMFVPLIVTKNASRRVNNCVHILLILVSFN
jgi:hypothetical protein